MSDIFNKTYVVIPAFNEAKAIGGVIDDIKKEGFHNIIVVDDGCRDNTYDIAKEKGAIALKHLINRGKGAATQTGLDACKILGAEIVVTIDADGQHDPKDILRMAEPIEKQECEVVLGSRLLGGDKMPLSRKIVNIGGNIITYLFYGIYVSDSQSGLRSYSKKAYNLIDTTFDRYEFESEVLEQVKKNKLKYIEIPIQIRYTDYSLTKWNHIKGFEKQKFFNSFKMLFRMVIRTLTT